MVFKIFYSPPSVDCNNISSLEKLLIFSFKQCTSSYSKCLDVQKMSEKKEVTLKILLGKLVKVCILNWVEQDLGKACIADFESDATL
jgi:hypothetical protein